MKPNHKRRHCLNCHFPFSRNENYCPRCGQVNNDFRLSAWELLKEFFDNYLNFDSRMYRTVFPFLLMPGHLTVSFVNGRRKRYVHPVRLYLIVSLFFFFVFSQSIDWDQIDLELSDDEEIEQLLKSKYFSDSTENTTMKDVLDKAVVDYQLPEEQAAMIEQRFSDKDKRNLLALYYEREEKDQFSNVNFSGSRYRFHQGKLWNIWIKDENITPDALLDSAQASQKTAFNRYLAGQIIKIGTQDDNPRRLLGEIIDNIPIAIFFLIPIFAFFLKVVYIRSHKLYIEHLIATFNIHTYIFLFFGFALLFQAFGATEPIVENALLAALWLSLIYTVLMFRRVYKQGWIKTLFKLLFLFSTYSVFIVFFSIFEVLASVLLF